MKVAELIAMLQKMPQDLEVYTTHPDAHWLEEVDPPVAVVAPLVKNYKYFENHVVILNTRGYKPNEEYDLWISPEERKRAEVLQSRPGWPKVSL